MIPKIAHFHWDQSGPSMSWLRTVSIASFAKFNPEWEIRLIRSDPSFSGHRLCYGNRADLSWWLALKATGGFQVATDIVFRGPVPDAWLDAELCACTSNGLEVSRDLYSGGGRVYQFAMMGATAGHPFMVEAVKEAQTRIQNLTSEQAPLVATPPMGYQALGVDLLSVIKEHMGPTKELPMNALCYYDDSAVDKLWEVGPPPPLPDEAIGIHWYGGHVASVANEFGALPVSGFRITEFANQVFP